MFGVNHHLSPEHLQRYLDEMGFRWSHRGIETKTGRNGKLVSQMKTAPFEIQLGKLLRHAVGRELRYSAVGGIRKPAGRKARSGGSAKHRPPDEIPF